jgi:predicted ArsR family transcriptional regulator
VAAPLTPDADRIGSDDVDSTRPGSADTRFAVFKALGDNTRYAAYLELARSPTPLSTADIAERLGLHVNTVRPHLERMREVGLLDVHAAASGTVGRPQHRYALAADAPALGLEPSAWPTIARVLLEAVADAGLSGADLAEAGAHEGRSAAGRLVGGAALVDVVVADQQRLGFDPAVAQAAGSATVAFAHCPFRDLAERYPALVCALHEGMVRGVVESSGGGRVGRFRSLVDAPPCRVELSISPGHASSPT